MGREYARAGGEPEEVALAIFEHYLPRNADGRAAHAGRRARSSAWRTAWTRCAASSPSARRPPARRTRSACGARASPSSTSCSAAATASRSAPAVDEALELLEPKIADIKRKAGEPAPREQVLEFFRGRLKALWAETAPDGRGRGGARGRLRRPGGGAASGWTRSQRLVGRADFAPLAVAFKRVANIVEKQGKDVAAGRRPTRPASRTSPRSTSTPPSPRPAARWPSWCRSDDFAGALKEITGLQARRGHLLRQGDGDGRGQGPAREPHPVPHGDRRAVQPGGRLFQDPGRGCRRLSRAGGLTPGE